MHKVVGNSRMHMLLLLPYLMVWWLGLVFPMIFFPQYYPVSFFRLYSNFMGKHRDSLVIASFCWPYSRYQSSVACMVRDYMMCPYNRCYWWGGRTIWLLFKEDWDGLQLHLIMLDPLSTLGLPISWSLRSCAPLSIPTKESDGWSGTSLSTGIASSGPALMMTVLHIIIMI